MTGSPTLADLYRRARERLTDVVLDAVRADPGADDRPVPATPGWTVHDAVAHLTCVAEDLLAGQVPRTGPTPEWTAGQVERGRGVTTEALLESWAGNSPAVEELLGRRPVWPLVLDVGAHELDVRAALGDTGARDNDLVIVGSTVLLRGLRVPQPLVVHTEHVEVAVGPADDDPEDGDAGGGDPVTLRTTAFEAFRWRLGRRSRHQLAAMDWSGDPAPFLDHLCVFGPAEHDLEE